MTKKRALLSVSDKNGIEQLAEFLIENNFEIISTGGTAGLLEKRNLNISRISSVTDFPEILGGRVKTLHPNIHGGILADREEASHLDELISLNITPIDLVVVNLYPFSKVIHSSPENLALAIENIDIGGVTLLRAAAKNYKDVIILSSPEDYKAFMERWPEKISNDWKQTLAVKAFRHTAAYDIAISEYLDKRMERKSGDFSFPPVLNLSFGKVKDLRYGENPHQKAALYRVFDSSDKDLTTAEQLQGKELSYNNLNDANAALELLDEFSEPVAVAVKHQNPCGVSSADTLFEAYQKVYMADPVSIFGGIVAFNRRVDGKTAAELSRIFLEVIIAPDYDAEALEILKKKKMLRVLRLPAGAGPAKSPGYRISEINGGILVQEEDSLLLNVRDIEVVTERKPDEREMKDLLFAWKVVKHVRSNAIVLAKDLSTVGIGPGQTSRIWALEGAAEHAKLPVSGSILASDAFFPFGDSVEKANELGITAIIQPGGSIRDKESIELCDKYGIAMVFTGIRHFKH